MAQNVKRSGGSAINERTTRHAGYAISQQKRKRIEESFGWLKTIALMRKVRHRGIHKVGWAFTFAAAARVRRKRAKRAADTSLTLVAVTLGAADLQFDIMRVTDSSKTQHFSATC